MTVILYLILGIIVISILFELLKFVLKVCLGTAGLAGFSVANLFNLFFYNKLLVVLFLLGLYFFDTGIGWSACFVIYGSILNAMIKSDGKKEVEKNLKNLIDNEGIILKQMGDSVTPKTNNTKIIFKAFYDKEAAKNYLAKAVKDNVLEESELADGNIYYYRVDALQKFAGTIQSEVYSAGNQYFEEYGILYDLGKIINMNSDMNSKDEMLHTPLGLIPNPNYKKPSNLSQLKNSYRNLFFKEFCKSLIKNPNVKETKADDKTVYLSPSILLKKWETINGSLQIDSEQFKKTFGNHFVIIQEVIMNEISAQYKGLKYIYYGANSLWIEENYLKSHTCARCKKFFAQIKKYGPNIYCSDCLNDIHADEDAREEAGETVKRYISDPPPGMKIRQ